MSGRDTVPEPFARVAQLDRGVDQVTARDHDHAVADREVLLGAVGDRPHAFGHGMVLLCDAVDARIGIGRSRSIR
jgi:hypothetical protein